jgi:murein DD-endopeptidase MepM/ murein hydrolase activator NlpD
MKLLTTIGVFLMMALAGFAQESLTPDRALELGRKYTAALYANDTATLWPVMTDRMKEDAGSQEKLGEFNDKARKQLGRETKLLREVVLPNNQQYLIYTRLSEFDQVPFNIIVQFTFDSAGRIAGFFVTRDSAPAGSQFLDYKDKTVFTLPMTGEWTVYQGGRTVFDNYHAATKDQRFAYDLLVIKNARMFSNKGDDLTDYHSFGLPVLAPAGGKVVAVIDEYDDNQPLMPSKDAPAYGNSIVIDHGRGEFSMLAHLKRGSVKVKVGDAVAAGQQIAQCGNSGNSPLPHLHYHLQTTSEWWKGEGLPIQFHDYISNGKPVTVGEPSRGEVLQRK